MSYPAVDDTRAALQAALQGVSGLSVYASPGVEVLPPAAVLTAPTLTWETYSEVPTRMSQPVMLVAAADEQAIDTLLDLIPAVRAAVASVTACGPGPADPGVFPAGSTELPADRINVDVALSRRR